MVRRSHYHEEPGTGTRSFVGAGLCERERCDECPPPRVPPPPPPILCGDCFRENGTCDCGKITWVDHAPFVAFFVMVAIGLYLKYLR